MAMGPEVRFTSLIGWDPARDGQDAPQPYVAPRWGTLEHDECARLAEVILDQEGGVPTALAIVDYKTSTTGDVADHALQLQVYTDAGRREGLDVRAAYVHDLKAAERDPVPVDVPAITVAENTVADAAIRLRARFYSANPGKRCRTCEVRTICRHAHL